MGVRRVVRRGGTGALLRHMSNGFVGNSTGNVCD